MKQRYLLLFPAILFCHFLSAQILWTETFSNSCTAGCLASSYVGPNGAWTQTITGAEGADANTWFVSCSENGNGQGNCGTGCGSNQTLHISAAIGNPFCPNDCGASYDAGGLCGTFTCPQTSRRIESPVIDCSNTTTTTAISFLYLAQGAAPNDQCFFWYHDGSTWSMVQALPATNNANCSGQGLWTNLLVVLPPSAIGNPNVRIGFEWVNNDDGVGTDPSIAIDDVMLSVFMGVENQALTEVKAAYDATSDQITIQSVSQNENTNAGLFSMDGKKVLSQQLNSSPATIDVSALAPGIYLLQLTGEGRNYSPVKLVIE